MFKRILVPIDGSAHSMKAAEMAIDLARTFKTDLTLLHVARRFDLPDQLKDYIKAEHLTAHDMLAIDEATKRVIADIKMSAEKRGIKKIKTVFREGKPARSIVDYAEKAQIDAINGAPTAAFALYPCGAASVRRAGSSVGRARDGAILRPAIRGTGGEPAGGTATRAPTGNRARRGRK